MNYRGVLEFLAELQEKQALGAFELESVEQIGLDESLDMRFAVTISCGPLRYRLTSYIPPTQVRDELRRIVDHAYDF